MQPLARYGLSAVVALAVTAVAALFADSHGSVVLSLPILYGATAILTLAHRDAWARVLRLGRRHPPSRRVGALGAGVAAFAGSFLLRVSVPVGLAGIGMLLLGASVAVADPVVRRDGWTE